MFFFFTIVKFIVLSEALELSISFYTEMTERFIERFGQDEGSNQYQCPDD